MRHNVQWKLCLENDLQLSDHVELAEFFRKTYGPTGAYNAKPFEGSRSWAGARPELRAIAYDSSGVAAHLGLLRRFIKVDGVDLLVAELGLYGVRPDLEGLGIAHSIHVMRPTLEEFQVPFAFGTVRHEMRKHIERFGRHGLLSVASAFTVRSTLPHARIDLPPTRVENPLVLIVPVGRPISEWPAGTIIDRNGPEL
ncbi:NodA family N-acyltransferase [Mesorhizobium sp. USDA-HM6]|nr:NodA family N-acyltransferase [Mesorhizobium sp. USDA-HM6]